MFKSKKIYYALILSLLLVPHMAQSMQPDQSSLIRTIRSHALAIEDYLIERYGPAVAEAALKMVGWYLKIKETLKPQPKPVDEFAPIKTFGASISRFLKDRALSALERHQTKIIYSSAAVSSFLWICVLIQWYKKKQQEKHP